VPDNANAIIKPSAAGLPAKLCKNQVRIPLLYRKVTRIA
jgi:hypothetical protein